MSLNLGRAEWKALAIKWSTGRVSEEEQAELSERMSRTEKRRFEKMLEDVAAKKVHSGDAFVTGRQLSHYFGSFTEQSLMPMAARADDTERKLLEVSGLVDYLMLPFWSKWWVKLRLRLISFNHWLNRHGIRFVQLNEETTDGDPEILTDDGALGSEPQGIARDAVEDGESSPQHGLHEDGNEPVHGAVGSGGPRIIASSRGGRG